MEPNSPPEVTEFLTRQAQDWHADAKTPPSVTEAVRSAVFTEKKSWGGGRISRWQIAATAILLIAPVSFVGMRLLPNPTLAAIARAMSEVRTAEWRTNTEQHDPKTGTLVRTLREHIMIDLERNAGRVELEPDNVYIVNAQGSFWLRGKKFIPEQTTKSSAPLREVLQRRIFNGKEIFKNKEEWRIGETVVEGRRLLDLNRTVAETVPAGSTGHVGTIQGIRQEIWADPETFRIVQIRYWFKQTEGDPPHRVMDVTSTAHSYEYDKPIPESGLKQGPPVCKTHADPGPPGPPYGLPPGGHLL